MTTSKFSALPEAQGLYDPAAEHDARGVAFVATLSGVPSHTIVEQALTALRNLDHRGASGAEPIPATVPGFSSGSRRVLPRHRALQPAAGRRVRGGYRVPAPRRRRCRTGRRRHHPYRRGRTWSSSAGGRCRSTPPRWARPPVPPCRSSGSLFLGPASPVADHSNSNGAPSASRKRVDNTTDVTSVAVVAHHRLQGGC